MREPYDTEDAPGRHAPSHFCTPIGGRRACAKEDCGFCGQEDSEE